MKSLWDDAEAATYHGPLGPRVYGSRLLGRDRSLVLHGGGNTSVRFIEKNVFGEDEEVLYVKASGWDLETIGAEGFVPVALAPLRRLATLEALADRQIMNELAIRGLRSGAPAPSVETLLHAVLPHKYVDHTHADAILSLGNAPNGEQRAREAYGDEAIVLRYVMSGFGLAVRCAQAYAREAGKRTLGMVLLSHGVVSFGAGARESYERMIALVSRAEACLQERKAWHVALPEQKPVPEKPEAIARLRQQVSECAGFPLLLRVNSSPQALAFARHPDVARLSQQGPATPDHVLYTKPVPLLGRDVAAYAARYKEYFDRHAPGAKEVKTMLDPAPRIVLDPQLGLAAAGRTAREAAAAAELYEHTIDVILRAEALGGWRSVSEREIFEVEYWELEQAKLRRAARAPRFAGEVALVTGAASGIGKACVEAFLRRGAAVAALDLDPDIERMWDRPDVLCLKCDLVQTQAVQDSLDRAVRRFGGLDMLVLNAGVFPGSQPIERVAADAWRKTMAVNVEANLDLMQRCHGLLAASPRGGRIVVIGSRNVPAPGPGAAAYSASKAAMNQLARVAALEWAKDRIRINSLHPDAVYDTGLWTEELLASRARAYDLTVEQYKRRNLLKTEVYSRDVAELAAEMCGPLFAKTTGAQVPVDGGNERVV
jgi:rhamnose utilization protein RhaD (predicted bifunctional aldolase and dehydrogenase)/NAD(P)-dependent dehydrogenase (short-subunit alcohol dehydrogenase family)